LLNNFFFLIFAHLKFTLLHELLFCFSRVNYVDVCVMFSVSCLVRSFSGINGSTWRGKRFFFPKYIILFWVFLW